MQALVVGGEFTFVRDVLASRLQGVGIEVASIWDWDHKKAIQSIPAGCECVIVVKDMTSHIQRDVARTLAKRGGLPFAEIPRKWAVALQDLIRAGLVKREGDSMSRRKNKVNGKNKTSTLVLQEDYTQTLTRIVNYSKTYYAKKARRPKAAEVSTALGIPTYHVALQKGINQGVATAKGLAFKTDNGTPLNELVEMALQDNPEWVLDINAMTTFLAELMEKSEDYNFRKSVKDLSLAIQKRWRRAGEKRGTHPERVFLKGLMLKWFESHCRTVFENEGKMPTRADADVDCTRIFQTHLLSGMYDRTMKELSPDAPADVQETAETISVEATTDQERGVAEPSVAPTETETPASTEGSVDEARSKMGSRKQNMSLAIMEAIAKHFDMLGNTYDTEVAKLCDVSVTSICRYRQQLGIPAFRKGKGKVKATKVKTTKVKTKATFQPTLPKVEAPIEVSLAQVEINGIEGRLSEVANDQRLLTETTREQHESLRDQLSELTARVETLADMVGSLTQGFADIHLEDSRRQDADTDSLGAHINALVAKGFKVNIQIDAGE